MFLFKICQNEFKLEFNLKLLLPVLASLFCQVVFIYRPFSIYVYAKERQIETVGYKIHEGGVRVMCLSIHIYLCFDFVVSSNE